MTKEEYEEKITELLAGVPHPFRPLVAHHEEPEDKLAAARRMADAVENYRPARA